MKILELQCEDLVPDTLWRYALNLLPDEEMAAIEIHCGRCNTCAENVAAQVEEVREARRFSPRLHGAVWREEQWKGGAAAALVGAAAAPQSAPVRERFLALAAAGGAGLLVAAKVVWKAPEVAGKKIVEALEAVALKPVPPLVPATAGGAMGMVRVRGAVRTRGAAPAPVQPIQFDLPGGGRMEVRPAGAAIEFVITQSSHHEPPPAVIFAGPPGPEMVPVLPEWDDEQRRWFVKIGLAETAGEFVVVPLREDGGSVH